MRGVSDRGIGRLGLLQFAAAVGCCDGWWCIAAARQDPAWTAPHPSLFFLAISPDRAPNPQLSHEQPHRLHQPPNAAAQPTTITPKPTPPATISSTAIIPPLKPHSPPPPAAHPLPHNRAQPSRQPHPDPPRHLLQHAPTDQRHDHEQKNPRRVALGQIPQLAQQGAELVQQTGYVARAGLGVAAVVGGGGAGEGGGGRAVG